MNAKCFKTKEREHKKAFKQKGLYMYITSGPVIDNV